MLRANPKAAISFTTDVWTINVSLASMLTSTVHWNDTRHADQLNRLWFDRKLVTQELIFIPYLIPVSRHFELKSEPVTECR